MTEKTHAEHIAELTMARDQAVAELRHERLLSEGRITKLEGVIALTLAKFSAIPTPGPVPNLVGSTLMALRVGKKVEVDIEFDKATNNANLSISVDGIKL